MKPKLRIFLLIWFIQILLMVCLNMLHDNVWVYLLKVINLALVFSLFVFNLVYQAKYQASRKIIRNGWYILSFIIPLAFFASSYTHFLNNYSLNSKEIHSFTGTSFYEVTGHYTYNKNGIGQYYETDISHGRCPACGEEPGWLYLKSKDDIRMRFRCDILNAICYSELIDYFKKNQQWKGREFTVKYTVWSKTFSQNTQNLLYEIKYQDNILYGIDYFEQKYQQQKQYIILLSFDLIINFVLFAFVYQIFFFILKIKIKSISG